MKGDKPPHPVKIGRLGSIRIMPSADFCLERLNQRRKPPFHLTGKNAVTKFGFWVNFLSPMMLISNFQRGMRYVHGSVAGQKRFVENGQSMFRLPDLPVSNALTLRQICQKGLNIFSRSVPQMLFRQETGKSLCPSHIKGRTVLTYPIFLRAGPEGFPELPLLFVLGGFNVSVP